MVAEDQTEANAGIGHDGTIEEKFSRQLYLDGPGELASVNKVISKYIETFLANVHQYKAFENPKKDGPPNHQNITNFGISNQGKNLDEILQHFNQSVVPSGIQPTSGGHMGYIPAGGIPLAAFGDFIAAVVNKYSGVFTACPQAVNLENKILEWCASLFGFDVETFGGNLCTGASIGTVMCVAAARDAHGIKSREYENAVIYTSAGGHFCLDKALNLIGMRESVVRTIPMDSHYRMDVSILEETLVEDVGKGLRPFLVIGTIGSTPTGSVDDISQLSFISWKHGCWFHVDAAYGGFFTLLPELQHNFTGIENADSICIDPHKSLFLPYGSGVVLVRKREHLLRTFIYSSALIDTSDRRSDSPADLSPELTRNFRGLRMWLPLMYHGVDAFVGALREKVALANYAYNQMKKLNYIDLGPRPELTLFVFRYNGNGIFDGQRRHDIDIVNGLNEELRSVFENDGRVYLTTTVLDGKLWFRVCVLGVRTHAKDMDTLLDMVETHYRQRCQPPLKEKMSFASLHASYAPFQS